MRRRVDVVFMSSQRWAEEQKRKTLARGRQICSDHVVSARSRDAHARSHDKPADAHKLPKSAGNSGIRRFSEMLVVSTCCAMEQPFIVREKMFSPRFAKNV